MKQVQYSFSVIQILSKPLRYYSCLLLMRGFKYSMFLLIVTGLPKVSSIEASNLAPIAAVMPACRMAVAAFAKQVFERKAGTTVSTNHCRSASKRIHFKYTVCLITFRPVSSKSVKKTLAEFPQQSSRFSKHLLR